MIREKIIEELIEAAREWKESKEWAGQNPRKMLSSSMTGEEAAEVMKFYFDKERALLDIIDALDEIDGVEKTKTIKDQLEDLEK